MAAMAFVSCQKEITLKVSDKTIKARISSSALETKAIHGSDADSRVISSNLLMELGTDQALYLDVIESAGIHSSSAPMTKGQLITTEKFSSATVDAYLGIPSQGITNAQGETLSPHYIDKGSLSPDGSVTIGGEPCYWVNDVDMYMWCYSGVNLNSGNTSASFSYVTPSALADQKDILVSYNKLHYKEGVSDFADVRLHHALAAVRFDFRLLPAGTSVKSIELSGVKTKGDCTVLSTGGQDLSFEWSNTSTPGTFTLTGLDATNRSEFVPAIGEMFFFIPQQLGEDAKITMTFESSDAADPKTPSVSLSTSNWKAGYTYTYRVKAKFTMNDKPISTDGTITFNGKNSDKAKFKDLQLVSSTVLRLNWESQIGNVNEGRVTIKIVFPETSKPEVILYDRIGYTNFVSPTRQNGERWHDFQASSRDVSDGKGSQHYGTCSMYFILEELGLQDYDQFSIEMTYGGKLNNGNALWYLTNLDLSIVENYDHAHSFACAYKK